MKIYNNVGALNILNIMNRNVKDGNKSTTMVATGEKFNSAGLNSASEYSISEKMRVKIRGLDQCNDNSQNGRAMVNIAEKAVATQVEILKKVRAIAMQASDDTYTDVDRKALQDETTQLLKEVSDISHLTNYNNISLLDKSELTSKVLDSSVYNSVQFIPEGSIYVVPTGDMPISISPPNIFDVNNVQVGSPLTNLPNQDDWICDSSGNTAQVQTDPITQQLYYDDLSGNPVPIQVSGFGGATSTNVFKPVYAAMTTMPQPGDKVAVTSEYLGPGGMNIATVDSTGLSAYPSQSNFYELDFSNPFNSGLNIPQDLDGMGFSLKCHQCSQHIIIQFDSSTTNVSQSASSIPLCYTVGISNVTSESDLLSTIFQGIASLGVKSDTSTTPQYIELASHHNVRLNYYPGSGKYAITKSDCGLSMLNGLTGEMVATIVKKPLQEIPIQTDTKSNQQVKLILPNTTLAALFPTKSDFWDFKPEAEDYPDEWPKSYSARYQKYCTALPQGLTPLPEEEWSKKTWLEEVWPYPADTVELDIYNCVLTRDDANQFIDDVDQALKYLLKCCTVLGSQHNRLGFTESNLTMAAENTTNSESVIRDADLGQAIVDKTKFDVLVQTSQATLAKQNELMQSVLSFLQ